MSIFKNRPKPMTLAVPSAEPDAGTATTPLEHNQVEHNPVEKTDAQWREELTPEEYRVLRQAGTERPYTGEYWDTHTRGVYQCRACGTELFTSNEKFDSHCGWPSFWAPLADGTVRYIHDRTMGMDRVEVRCATCDSHLGHVFDGEGYGTPTDQRYCINSVSLKLVPADDAGK
ncbi:peptide-methionine (R)-S-oxide reductase MsrB [Arthrobacter humicola]|uniref:peptide-methionine (R)-S-oxide reductase n=1 Tax=Arthrobacter humicola TaxID=409291 RepID=A0ABN2Z6B1_9MICC